jgi:hypothetical protein
MYLCLTLRVRSDRYIAVDGTSLTVCQVDRNEGWFTFMLIAYTQKHIIVPHKAVGDRSGHFFLRFVILYFRAAGTICSYLHVELILPQAIR